MPLYRNPEDLVANTRKTFNTGVTKNVNNRLNSLKNFLRFFQNEEEQIIKTICEDTKKHREEVRSEIFLGISHLNFLLDNVPKWVEPERPSKKLIYIPDGLYIYNDPLGVVLVMLAWNVPLLSILPATGAIAAGNCVVIKPPPESVSFGNFLAAKLPEYLDPNCFPVFLGDTAATKKLLDQRFDYISYMGSLEFGKYVHAAASKYLTPTTLEMGSKNPVYIDSSADLELAARRVMWGKCFATGQTCITPDYILCSKSVEIKFIRHAKSALEAFFNENQKMCPVANDRQFKRLQGLLSGLNVALGGHFDSSENYIEPTIVTDVPASHPIMKEIIFGPILVILNVDSVEEAADFINRKEKPLALYIFTENSSVRDYLINNTSTGAITVNDTMMHIIVESLPYGGVGFSGMGYYKAKYCFDSFVHKKSVLVRNSSKIIEKLNHLRYPPYLSRKTDIFGFFLQYRKGFSATWFGYGIVLLLIGVLIVSLYYKEE